MFYNDFIFDVFEKYQQKYQQKNLLPPLNSIFSAHFIAYTLLQNTAILSVVLYCRELRVLYKN